MYSKCRIYNFFSNRFLSFWKSLTFIFHFCFFPMFVAWIVSNKVFYQVLTLFEPEKQMKILKRVLNATNRWLLAFQIPGPVSKRFSLFKFKEGDNFNHRNTFSISRIKIWAWRRDWAKWDVLKLAHMILLLLPPTGPWFIWVNRQAKSTTFKCGRM